jgi:hypothetical protein
MAALVLHDIGSFKFHKLCPREMDCGTCHDCAYDYLANEIIQPLYEAKSIRIQGPDGLFESGETLQFDELTRLAKTKLLFYYVRDYVDFPKNIALIAGVIQTFKAPSETFFDKKGVCISQAMALAALLKMEGFDVAIGFMPSIGIPFMPVGLITHAYVFVKDEGWGIGEWKLVEDMFGNPMQGEWILLDPVWSPKNGGSANAQDYGENPTWVNVFTRPQMTWGLIDESKLPQLPLPDLTSLD